MTALATPQARTPVAAEARSLLTNLTGTWRLTRHALRTDRLRLSIWAGSIIMLYAYFVVALSAMGADALDGRALVMTSPTGVAMGGPAYGLSVPYVPGSYTIGVAMANEMILWVSIALGILAVLHIVRHTRAQEEGGLSEVVRSLPVGRHAPAVAAFLSLVIVQLLIAVISGFAMSAASDGEMPVTDSLAMALGIAVVALTFGAVATVTSQVTAHARGATGMAIGVLGLSYLVLVAGNLAGMVSDPIRHGTTLSWLSPIGWAQQLRAFVDLRWWPMLIGVAVIVVLLWLASFLANRRDYGAGLVASRPGRADAKASLSSPFGLAWRQQRTAFWCWLIGMAVMWGATGTMIADVSEMGLEAVAENPAFEAVFGGSTAAAVTAGFFMIMAVFIALACAAYGISMLSRARAEEASGRLELALATPVSRTRWLGAQLAVACLSTALVWVASILAMYAGAVSVGVDDPGFGAYLQVIAFFLPALAVYIGLAAALYAWAPRLMAWAWILIAWGIVIGIFGPAFDAPEWLSWIDPMFWARSSEAGHGPFSGNMPVGGPLGLAVVAVALFALAFAGFRRRDVPAV